MKKLIFLFCMCLILFSCNGQNNEEYKKAEEVKKAITEALKIKTGDNFYFIQGIDYDSNPSTNIKYRGILYSDKLREYNSPSGVEIALETLDINESIIDYIAQSYIGVIRKIELDSMVENKAIKIFGEKTNLWNDWTMTEGQYNWIKTRLGKKDLPYEEKNGARSTIVNVFVDDLDKLDNEDIKRKTFELAKYIYDDMNYVTALQVYVRDNKYFEDYELVNWSINSLFREREDIQNILKKIKNKVKITEDEKISLVRVFDKGGLNFDYCHLKFFLMSFDEEKEVPFKLENVTYEMEKKLGEYIFFRKEG